MAGQVHLEYRGEIAVITNDNPAKHNAFDDDMDAQLFAILRELTTRRDVRAVVWRGEGASWSSGRDVAAIGGGQVTMTHHELMRRGHRVEFADGPYGGYQAIMKNPNGGWVGASESRKDGQAAGF